MRPALRLGHFVARCVANELSQRLNERILRSCERWFPEEAIWPLLAPHKKFRSFKSDDVSGVTRRHGMTRLSDVLADGPE